MNHLYFLIHIVDLKAIPWQRALEETDEDIAPGVPNHPCGIFLKSINVKVVRWRKREQ